MNKYINALERYKRVCNYHECVLTADMFAVETLQELVEKETPRKPDYEGDGCDKDGNIIYDTWICPNCGKSYEVGFDDYDYCPNCGQHIDWSNVHDNKH